MHNQDDLLRRACAMLAEEETRQLEDHLSPAQIREAEELFHRHRMNVLSLIAKETKKKKRGLPAFLKAAACLVLIAGAAYIALHQNAPDPQPMTPVPSASVIPYYSSVPTETTIPSATPKKTEIPTYAPTFAPTETLIPTNTSFINNIPEVTPTFTPIPTSTPSPAPTQPPSAETNGLGDAPNLWQGAYFPQYLPEGYAIADTEEDGLSHSIVYTKGTSRIIFTEYEGQKLLSIPENARISYIQLGDLIALKMETESSIILSWEQEGYTFSLTCPDDQAEEIAASVKKIFR